MNKYYYIVIINLLTFIVFAIDKKRAKRHRKHKKRVKNTTLITLSAIGGSLGGLLAMHTFRHKTQNSRFRYGIPLILIAHILLFILILR